MQNVIELMNHLLGLSREGMLIDEVDARRIASATAELQLHMVHTNALDVYQRLAMRTAPEPHDNTMLAVFGLGVAGEAGEVAELIKKFVGHGHDLDPTKLTKELGDVLWYVAVIARSRGIDLSEVAARNVAKLQERYPEGFSHEASRERKA